MKKLLVRSVFVLGLVSGFGASMAQSASKNVQPEAVTCNDYLCLNQCLNAGYSDGWCNPSCICVE